MLRSMTSQYAGLLAGAEERIRMFEEMRNASPATTCDVFNATCEQVKELPVAVQELMSCRCLDRANSARNLQQATSVASAAQSTFGALGSHPKMTFETFRPNPDWREHEAKSALSAKELCLEYADDPHKLPFLTLFGNVGAGKTHLAMAIAQSVDLRVLWAVSPDMLDHLRSTFNRDNRLNFDEEFERIKTAELLVIDDLSAEYHRVREDGSSWAPELLYKLINHRHWNELPTVITTNEDVLAKTGRMGSRIRDTHTGRLVRLDVRDNRLAPRRR